MLLGWSLARNSGLSGLCAATMKSSSAALFWIFSATCTCSGMLNATKSLMFTDAAGTWAWVAVVFQVASTPAAVATVDASAQLAASARHSMVFFICMVHPQKLMMRTENPDLERPGVA